jgi:hypothetical protein
MTSQSLIAAIALVAASTALAQSTAQPSVDPKAHPAMGAMLQTLQNGSEASRYCARTGGLFLEADALLRKNVPEREVVEALVAGNRGPMSEAEMPRFRQIAKAVTDLAAGFRALAPESAPVAYTQTCLASARQAAGTRQQAELNERFANAIACDRRFKPGSLEGKECIAQSFQYR